MTTINNPIRSKVLVELSSFTSAISKEDKLYYRVSCTPIAKLVDGDNEWSCPSSIESEFSYFRVGAVFFDIWMQHLTSTAGLPLVVEFEYTVKDSTTYEDDGELKYHSQTGFVPVSVQQATMVTLMRVNKSVDIMELIPYYQQAMSSVFTSNKPKRRLED